MVFNWSLKGYQLQKEMKSTLKSLKKFRKVQFWKIPSKNNNDIKKISIMNRLFPSFKNLSNRQTPIVMSQMMIHFSSFTLAMR